MILFRINLFKSQSCLLTSKSKKKQEKRVHNIFMFAFSINLMVNRAAVLDFFCISLYHLKILHSTPNTPSPPPPTSVS